jgi:crotonobetainyl-CoA:carnitine CoA-transferase CaiB-like acyl-CoA transferase
VFVTNLRPGSVGRLRLRYPDIAAIRPDVIYCRAHGFPSDGPQADAPAFDDIIQAACGVPDVLRRASGRPGLMPTLLADKVSGLVLAYSIIATLFHRARTGDGQQVEVRGALRTADGWIAVQPHRAAHWAALLRAAGHDDLVGDPRLSRKASTRRLNRSGWSALHTWPASGITACAALGSLAAMYSAAPR